MRLIKKALTENQLVILVIAAALSLFVAYVVYQTDGTKNPFPHLMYIPIILAAVFGTWPVVIGNTLFSGFLVSHWVMPLSVSLDTVQEPISSYFRLALFLLIGLSAKALFDYQRDELRRLYMERSKLYRLQQASLGALIDLAETRDTEVTGGHLRRLEEYAKQLLAEMDLAEDYKMMIASTMGFHDIGKVAIPDRILLKPGPLDASEWESMQQHTIIGARILGRIEDSVGDEETKLMKPYLTTAREIALYHHERFDGKGYPEGLQGEQIPISARVAAICDVYDAVRAERPYKEPLTHQQTVEMIANGRGSHFDPQLVDIFLEQQELFAEIFELSELDPEGFSQEWEATG